MNAELTPDVALDVALADTMDQIDRRQRYIERAEQQRGRFSDRAVDRLIDDQRAEIAALLDRGRAEAEALAARGEALNDPLEAAARALAELTERREERELRRLIGELLDAPEPEDDRPWEAAQDRLASLRAERGGVDDTLSRWSALCPVEVAPVEPDPVEADPIELDPVAPELPEEIEIEIEEPDWPCGPDPEPVEPPPLAWTPVPEAPLPLATPDLSALDLGPPPRRAVLVSWEGTHDERVWPIDRDTIRLGRGARNDVQVRGDGRISRFHCALRRASGDQIYVEDLGSANGTWIDGQRVVEPRLLIGGEEIALGETTLRFRLLES